MTALHSRPPGRAVLLALAVLVLAVAPARAAFAHAVLLATDPAEGAVLDRAPAEVVLTFNEPVQPVEDGMRLVDGSGGDQALDTTTRDSDVVVAMPLDLTDGGYYLNWRVVSADSHPIAGVLPFTVGASSAALTPPTEPEAPPPWAGAAANALHYLGLLVFTGYLFFRTVIARGAWPARPRHRILRAAAAAAVLGAALAVPIAALDTAGLPLERITEPGAWTGSVRPSALLVPGLTVGGLAAAYTALTAGARRWAVPTSLTAAAVALTAPVLAGHSMAFGVRRLMLASDAVHLAAGAIWVGGLAGLLVMLTLWRRAGDPVDAAAIVTRFSTWAGYTVAALGASGLVMTLSIHRTWDGLLTTDHGRTLIAKLALVAAALALAGWNRFRLIPLIGRAEVRNEGLRRLRRVLAAEAAAVASVALVTGLLVNAVPAVEPPAPPLGGEATANADLGDDSVTAFLSPGTTGENTLMLTLTGADGAPLEPIEPPVVSATLPEEDFGPIDAVVHDLGDGEYHCLIDLPLTGIWEVTVEVRVSEFESRTAMATFEVGGRSPD